MLRNTSNYKAPAQALILKSDDHEALLTEARRLGSALICLAPGPGGQPCGLCSHCRQIASGTYPYWYAIVPQGAAYLIRIGQIRELQSGLMTKAGAGQSKIVVFLDAHRMREESQNCLLKTLEEPPGDALLLLLTERPQDLLPTVRSRCQLFDLGYEPQTPDRADRELAAEVLRAIHDNGYYGVFEKAAFVEGSRKKALPDFLSAMERLLRDGMIDCLKRGSGEGGQAYIEALDQVWKAGYMLERNVNPLLVLENLFLNLKKLDVPVKPQSEAVEKNEATQDISFLTRQATKAARERTSDGT